MSVSITRLAAAPRMAPLYVRAVLSARRSGKGSLPDTVLVREAAPIDADHLADYARVCGFDLASAVPITYPHVLGFGLQMQLMTAGDFPYAVLGMVHLANTFTQVRPITVDESPELRVSVGEPGTHRRGATFVVTTEAVVDGEAVWTGRSTYLSRGSSSSGSPDGSGSSGWSAPEPVDPGPVTVRWRVPGDIGRRYAEVSGDRNPIHLHPLTARLFGFPRPIAHGMWTVARCLGALGGRLPAATTVEVSFAKPVPLPSSVDFHSRRTDAGWEFALTGKGDKPHLRGAARPVSGE